MFPKMAANGWVKRSIKSQGRPAFVNSYHINMVKVDQDGISLSGLNTQALLAVSADLSIKEICSLPRGCHNAMPIGDGVIFNDTASDAVRLVTRTSGEISVPVLQLSNGRARFYGCR